MGGHPVEAILGQRASRPQAVEVEVGIACLVPGGSNQRRAELAAQGLRTKRAERLADGAAQQWEQETCVGQDEGIEDVRHGTHGVAVGGRQQLCALRFAPLGCGPRLTVGTVTIPA